MTTLPTVVSWSILLALTGSLGIIPAAHCRSRWPITVCCVLAVLGVVGCLAMASYAVWTGDTGLIGNCAVRPNEQDT